jgi:hypothetical protein
VFELHYEYLCSAGWREEKVKRLENYEQLDDLMAECREKGWIIKENPICQDCERFPQNCPGTRNHIWTGCVNRKVREKE